MEKIHINSSKLSDVIEKFDKPTKIYIPLMDKNGNSYKMLVKVGDYVTKGQILGKVGPKYVDGVIGNKYKDSTRKIHKWSHNWAPFTLWYENQQ